MRASTLPVARTRRHADGRCLISALPDVAERQNLIVAVEAAMAAVEADRAKRP